MKSLKYLVAGVMLLASSAFAGGSQVVPGSDGSRRAAADFTSNKVGALKTIIVGGGVDSGTVTDMINNYYKSTGSIPPGYQEVSVRTFPKFNLTGETQLVLSVNCTSPGEGEPVCDAEFYQASDRCNSVLDGRTISTSIRSTNYSVTCDPVGYKKSLVKFDTVDYVTLTIAQLQGLVLAGTNGLEARAATAKQACISMGFSDSYKVSDTADAFTSTKFDNCGNDRLTGWNGTSYVVHNACDVAGYHIATLNCAP